MKEKLRKNRILLLTILLAAVYLLTSCKGLELENKTEQVEGYTRSQAMILIANERNRYQNAYTGEIWSVLMEDGGQTFAELTIANVKEYLENIQLLCMAAKEQGITVTGREKEQIRQMTEKYMESLTEEDIAFIGCSREDVQEMYTNCFLAGKTAEKLTEKSLMDLSDSEVKVIRIQQIGTADEKKAKAILKKIKIDGSDFSSMASRYSELDQIEVELKRDTDGDLIEETAFLLEEGKVSNILFQDGIYYIIKCVDGYDREATKQRRQQLEAAICSAQFQEALKSYRNEHQLVFTETFWEEVDLTKGKDCTVDCFFDIYRTYAER